MGGDDGGVEMVCGVGYVALLGGGAEDLGVYVCNASTTAGDGASGEG